MNLLKHNEEIEKEIRETVDYEDLLFCMRCGMCVNTCPTYRTFDKDETHSPRGRIALVRAIHEGKISATEEFKRSITHCVTCEKCVQMCPSKVKYIKILKGARKVLEKTR